MSVLSRPQKRSAVSLAALVFGVLVATWAVCCGEGGMPAGNGEDRAAGSPVAAPREPAEGQTSDSATAVSDWHHPRTDERQNERDSMVAAIRGYGLTDEKILAAMAAVPRHEFVPSRQSRRAYADGPLPIGYGQTISQPYIVAEMTRQLKLTAESKVLEIGTGSGYQAAVLTEFTPNVFTIEIIEALAKSAEERLARLGYSTVQVRRGDGYHGWAEEAPFDAIIVTAAAGQIPPPLVEQLADGGRMVIPVGGPFSIQTLMLIEKGADGSIRSRQLMAVRFVPLVRSR